MWLARVVAALSHLVRAPPAPFAAPVLIARILYLDLLVVVLLALLFLCRRLAERVMMGPQLRDVWLAVSNFGVVTMYYAPESS